MPFMSSYVSIIQLIADKSKSNLRSTRNIFLGGGGRLNALRIKWSQKGGQLHTHTHTADTHTGGRGRGTGWGWYWVKDFA